jgi:regulator of sigma E protease
MMTFITFVIILGILVLVHEMGHFFTARWCGVKCDEFGIGMAPRICGLKKVNGKWKLFFGNAPTEEIKSEDTIYSLNWLPIGGFVKIKGEDGEEKGAPDSFGAKKIWQRALILSAGVIMNIVLAAFCLIFAFMLGAPQVVDTQADGANVKDAKIQILSVIKDSPAEKAGIQMGDVFLAVDGNEFKTVIEIQNYLANSENKKVTLKIDRLGEQKTVEVTPVVVAEIGKPGMGVSLATTGIVSYPWYKAIWLGLQGTWSMFSQIIVAFASLIKNAFVGAPLGVDVSGPVGIAVMTGQVAKMGFTYILQFAALLSLNLAIINFLPIPAVDGGRIVFLIVEKIRGKAVNQRVEQMVHGIGFILLMVLIVFVTGRDIWKFKDMFINIWHKVI